MTTVTAQLNVQPPPAEFLAPDAPVDLSNCDREPIHLIGGVQPHGALLVADGPDLRVRRASANAAALLGTPNATLGDVLGAPLARLVGDAQAAQLAAAAGAAAADDAGRVYHPEALTVHGRAFEVVVHRNPAGLVLEFEPAPAAEDVLTLPAFHATVRRTMAAVARGTSVRAVAAVVADEVRRVTGFDRVWVYRFHDDWHGEIIAESRAAGVEESWLDLHYPAADIPAQARALFLRHWLRLIVDAGAAASPVEGAPNEAPLDLSDCVLRAVSPVHAEYLANMGVRASMSVSLVRDGRLWGLVSCHHYAGPRHVPYDVRAACELLAQAFSTQLGLVEENEDRDYALRLGEVRARLLERMARERDVVDGLVADPAPLLELTGAEGAAVCLARGETATVGRTPPLDVVAGLARWLAARPEGERDAFATDQLGGAYPPAAEYADVASGVLAVALSRVRPYYVLWFRPQAAQTMRWGGDPGEKPVRVGADGVARLSPRGSFAAWEQEVRGRSRPWRRAEVEAARALRGTVVDALITRADEVAALNRRLEQSNRELDDFAYVASHDLKEPLRGIHNYAAMVAEDYAGAPLDDDGLARLETIRRLTRRLDGLIDSLLEHARVNRLDLERRPVDANDALDDALDRLADSVAARRATVRVAGPLPAVRADRERLVEVFANLVSNALKYGGERPDVEVGAVPNREPVTFYVRDRGIGIEPRHHAAVFKLFKRLHPRDAYGGGSGAGLTIVQKIVERHGGRVWLESAPGAGATFFFTLGPDPATAPAA